MKTLFGLIRKLLLLALLSSGISLIGGVPGVTAQSVGEYRVRNGDPVRGEPSTRIFVERVAQPGERDPDGDGWVLVGRSNGAGEDGVVARWWLDGGGP
jgi:hypothetical protein